MDNKEYYIGIDSGTESVGWAVTDTNYNPLKFKGKTLMGVELFEEAIAADTTRMFRSVRRRMQRKQQRMKLVEMLFAEEIAKVDKEFFMRLNDSKYMKDDKSISQLNTLFNDENYKDKDFHNEFPTIFHLRNKLIESDKKFDIRLVYLAVCHIVKTRGHFLFDSLSEDVSMQNFNDLFEELHIYLSENFGLTIECSDINNFSKILKDVTVKRTEKGKSLCVLCGVKSTSKNPSEKQLASIIGLMAGLNKKLSDLYLDDALNDEEIKSISLTDDLDDKMPKLEQALGENVELIKKIKQIYDWGLLANILNDKEYLSQSKVLVYETHKSDLALLKRCINKFLSVKEKQLILKKEGSTDQSKKQFTYTKYINGGCIREDMCKFISSYFSKITSDDPDLLELKSKLETATFLPKQTNKDNGVIPYQVHCKELKAILKNAETHYPFLALKDSEGLSVSDKIMATFKFRVPYYVGPLNSHSNRKWLVRSDEKIYPWNFSKVVDIEQSAENFITNLTNQCTYIDKEEVLPKNSLLYCKYMVLNELNNLQINGIGISVKVKQDIYNNMFKSQYKVSGKQLKEYLVSNGHMNKNDVISGIDVNCNSSLKSYIDFKNIIDKHNDIDMVENLIKDITCFGVEKKLLKSRIQKRYGNVLDADTIEKVASKKYTDWARFSKKFLTGIYHVDKETGEAKNIITMLYETNNNLMQLLSQKFMFTDNIKEYNASVFKKQTVKEMVDGLYVSPSVKRPILQAIEIINELVKINKCVPKKIFIEMARAEDKVKTRKESRKSQLEALYKAYNDENLENLKAELSSKNESDFKRDRLYLYFTQLGRCMYTNEVIDIDNIFNETVYDIDHIYPQSKVKDDSLNNRVLVKRDSNAIKGDVYPIEKSIRDKMSSFWSVLKGKGLISDKKYQRLMRSTELNESDLNIFIERQLVETRQSTKELAKLLGILYPSDKTEIVYVKGNTVSDFRHDYDMLKSREVNDWHHAKDAYLNIVVGNVYNVLYTHNKANFIKGLKENGNSSISLNKIFSINNDKVWRVGANSSMSIVKNVMAKNNIIYTRYPYERHGEFFNQQPMKKGLGQAPLKASDDKLSDISKYGGYKNVSGAYFILVEHTKKGKRIRTFEPVYVYLKSIYEKSEDGQIEYCKTVLKLVDPKILIKKIKFDTLFVLDGFRMHITGRSNDSLLLKCAIQLCVDKKDEVYIKGLAKYNNKVIERKKYNEEIEVTKLDKITAEQNIALYDLLTDKLLNTVYKVKLSTIGGYLVEGREKFENFDINSQVSLLVEIVNVVHCNSRGGDFSLINKGNDVGKISLNKNLSNIAKKCQSFKIIYQSKTGVFEQEIDMLSNDFTPKRKG